MRIFGEFVQEVLSKPGVSSLMTSLNFKVRIFEGITMVADPRTAEQIIALVSEHLINPFILVSKQFIFIIAYQV